MRSASIRDRLRFGITPKFEVFYALNSLAEPWDGAGRWKRKAEASLPPGFTKAVEAVAPRAIMWPLLADTLRDAPPYPRFEGILEAIRSLDDSGFRRALLEAVFHDGAAVDKLLSGESSLGDAVKSEAGSGTVFLELLGLHPFRKSSAMASAFQRVIDEPAGYRAELAEVLDTFWKSSFAEDWRSLDRPMRDRVTEMESALGRTSLAAFAREVNLPVTFDERKRIVVSKRGAKTFAYAALKEIHLIPSAFNHSRFWAAYTDDGSSIRLFIPVFDPSLLRETTNKIDPALGFRALGDTTRYAIASVLARSAQTSVQLARAFDVSKATISHHVQVLRAAGLIHERATEDGVALTLDRDALEALSMAAAEEMFTSKNAPLIKRSRHETNARSRASRDRHSAASAGADE